MTLNGEMALILRYFTEFGSFRGALRSLTVVDKTITMDNLRLLCLAVNVCRGNARHPRYKHTLTARWIFCSRFINSRLNAQYLPSYRLDRKSYMNFRFVPKSVALNDEMAVFCVILSNLVVPGVHCVKVVDKAITMDNLRLLCLVVNVCRGPRNAHSINIL